MSAPEQRFKPEDVARRLEGFFPGELGIEVLETGVGGARGRLVAERRHLHPGGFVHGGVWVSLADTVAAWATIPNLQPGTDFSTAEMKTNLFGVAREGDLLEAVASPLHVGRRTQVWEVRVEVAEKLCALYVCTQVIVERPG
ncbi:MAG: 1,4-dihydroxy-2-naphthoyl-CoA hydrolase [Thermoleophilaceae bacterium]|nr:1,4-dihydroxy-2-naphthoyl-CoA hydrolase [Thermoleophilaceae bacterium]MEA2470825.1 1,4-dihydroxy-2-naphthoyl-CoA hydrolase [Thermoleophilaceae bacterium]